jgi:excisionase family DNA binding protein
MPTSRRSPEPNRVPAEPCWLTLEAAALRMSVSVKKVRRLIASGDLPAYTCGKRGLRVKPDDVDALMRPFPSARP